MTEQDTQASLNRTIQRMNRLETDELAKVGQKVDEQGAITIDAPEPLPQRQLLPPKLKQLIERIKTRISPKSVEKNAADPSIAVNKKTSTIDPFLSRRKFLQIMLGLSAGAVASAVVWNQTDDSEEYARVLSNDERKKPTEQEVQPQSVPDHEEPTKFSEEKVSSPEYRRNLKPALPFFTQNRPDSNRKIISQEPISREMLQPITQETWEQEFLESDRANDYIQTLVIDPTFTLIEGGRPTAKNLVKSLGSDLCHPAVSGGRATSHFGHLAPDLYGDWFNGHHTGTDYLGVFDYAALFTGEVVGKGNGFEKGTNLGLGPNTIFLRSLNPVGHDAHGHLLYAFAVYGHGQEVKPNIEVGRIVDAGVILGTSGAMGHTSEAHLHLETAIAPYDALIDNGEILTWRDRGQVMYFDSTNCWNEQMRIAQDKATHSEANAIRELIDETPPDRHFELTGFYADPKRYGEGQLSLDKLPTHLQSAAQIITVNINDGSCAIWKIEDGQPLQIEYQTQVLVGQKLRKDYVLSGVYTLSEHNANGSTYDGDLGVHYDHQGVPRDTLTPPLIGKLNSFVKVPNFAHVGDLTSIADISIVRQDGSVALGRSEYTIHQVPPVAKYAAREQALLSGKVEDVRWSTGCVNVATTEWQHMIKILAPTLEAGGKIYVIFSYLGIPHEALLKPLDYEINRDDPFYKGGQENWYNRETPVSFSEWCQKKPEAAQASIPHLTDLAISFIQTYLDQSYRGVDQEQFEAAIQRWETLFPNGSDLRLADTSGLALLQQAAINCLNGYPGTLPTLEIGPEYQDIVYFPGNVEFNSWINSPLGPLAGIELNQECKSFFVSYLRAQKVSVNQAAEIPRTHFIAAEILWRLATNNRVISSLSTARDDGNNFAQNILNAMYTTNPFFNEWATFFADSSTAPITTLENPEGPDSSTPAHSLSGILSKVELQPTLIVAVKDAFENWKNKS